jgi:hypothetical protein
VTPLDDLFEHREVKPHFINPRCFGEDFAAWLKRELSRFPELGVELSEPIPGGLRLGAFGLRAARDRFWIAFPTPGMGPQEAPAQWVVSVTY